jgi:hypothetical protein
MHFRAAHANFIVIAFNHFLEKPLKRIRFRYHLVTPFPCTTPSKCRYVVTAPALKRQQIGER